MSRIDVKMHSPSGTIILQRPEKRNALARRMIEDLGQALDDLHQEKKVRAVMLTGAGEAFSAGTDLQEVHDSSQADNALYYCKQTTRNAVHSYQDLSRRGLIPAVKAPQAAPVEIF